MYTRSWSFHPAIDRYNSFLPRIKVTVYVMCHAKTEYFSNPSMVKYNAIVTTGVSKILEYCVFPEAFQVQASRLLNHVKR